jgi:hypothetical protein
MDNHNEVHAGLVRAARIGALWGRYDLGAGLCSDAWGRAVALMESGVIASSYGARRACVTAYRSVYPMERGGVRVA